MDLIFYIILFTLIGSVVSLIGGVFLLINKKFALKVSHLLSSFAAGTLLGTAFFDLLPEAQELGGEEVNIFFWVLAGILIFFLLERFIHHHGHGEHSQDHQCSPGPKRTVIPLIVIGDTVHNFIDGVAMAATFLISIPLGIVTALAVAVHEIPQEIGDFGLMINKGMSRKGVILINIFSALAALAGAIVTYIARDSIGGLLPIALSLTSGFFIYIAAANLIPEIHSNENNKIAFWESVLLIGGVIMVWLVISLLGGMV